MTMCVVPRPVATRATARATLRSRLDDHVRAEDGGKAAQLVDASVGLAIVGLLRGDDPQQIQLAPQALGDRPRAPDDPVGARIGLDEAEEPVRALGGPRC